MMFLKNMIYEDNVSYEMMPSEQSLELSGHVDNSLSNNKRYRDAISMFFC